MWDANSKSVVLAIGLFFALSASISAAPGDLDPMFGSGGIVIAGGSDPNHLNTAWAMAIQSDGKIVVVGDGTLGFNWDFAVVRYNPDGSLDASFGVAGIVITQVDPINHEVAQSVAIQADGKIVVAGSRYVVRYNPNGSLDTSFNGTGIVVTLYGHNSVAIQSDGKIIAAGSSHDGSTFGFALVRYNADGSLDTTFNGTGKVLTPGGSVGSIAIQSDGKIVAAGGSRFGSNAEFMLVRHNADGTLDTTFNGTGIVTTSAGSSVSGASDLAIQPDGKIVAAGYGQAAPDWRTADFAVVRYNPNGSLDSSFGGTGKIIIPIGDSGDSGDYANSVAIQPNVKIVVAGSSSRVNIGSDFAVVRLNPNGSLDTSFSGTGTVITSVGNSYDHASSVAIQADGKIVVAGDTGSDFDAEFVVVRYHGDSVTPTPTTCPNPIDCADFFVRQHYRDFLSREPEPTGFEAWLRVLNDCPSSDDECRHQARITTSAGFFGSVEFQLKGYFVFRFYKVAFNRLPEYTDIAADMQSVTGLTPVEVYTRKANFTIAFAQRREFITSFGLLSNGEYVTALLARHGLLAVTTPDPAQPDLGAKVTLTHSDLVNRLTAGTLTRSQVLRAVADSDEVFAAEFNKAFVAMQYYGYLRRTPEELGYNDWLNYLNAHPQDFREMVRGFVDSIEYRRRFGQP
jgi:uncharacterized delta-60 repeat protein